MDVIAKDREETFHFDVGRGRGLRKDTPKDPKAEVGCCSGGFIEENGRRIPRTRLRSDFLHR